MKIKRLAASFGALKNRELCLAPGLNIVEAPNEGGKSTWCGFIRAMLYGVNTAQRDKAGFLSDKTRFRPWDGGPMEGIMELSSEGRDITIQRTALGASPMKKLSVTYSKTGQEVLELANDSLGEALTGVSEQIFERSAFIRQSGVQVSQTGQLEQRIASLVSSGDEGISYADTDAVLRSWQRKRRHNKSGFIPRLEAELVQVEDALARLEEANRTYAEIANDLDLAQARQGELLADLKIHEELESRAQRQRIVDAEKSIRVLDMEIGLLERSLSVNGKPITGAMVSAARTSYDSLGALTVSYTDKKTEKETAERELSLIDEEKQNSVFAGLPLRKARDAVSAAAVENLEADKAAEYKRERYTIPIAVLLVLTLAGLASGILLSPAFWGLAAVCAAGTAFLTVLYVRKRAAAGAAERTRQETLARYKCGSIDDLIARLEDYERLCGKGDELKTRVDESSAACDAAMAEMNRLRESFEAQVSVFAPQTNGLESAFRTMSMVEKKQTRLEAAAAEKKAADNLFQSLKRAYNGDWQTPIPKDGLRQPLRSKSETSYDLKRLEKELETLKHSAAIAMGELRALGDPVVLGARLNALTARKSELEDQFEALALASAVLAEANNEIQARFSPLLGRRAGYFLDRLTGGKYKRVLLDRDLAPGVERFGESVSRDILFLSGGTADQVYLALRLAICEMVLPDKNPCPIILDEALASFDEPRLHQALGLLNEMAQTRQVILFTCHTRESAFFSEDETVHVTRLPAFS